MMSNCSCVVSRYLQESGNIVLQQLPDKEGYFLKLQQDQYDFECESRCSLSDCSDLAVGGFRR